MKESTAARIENFTLHGGLWLAAAIAGFGFAFDFWIPPIPLGLILVPALILGFWSVCVHTAARNFPAETARARLAYALRGGGHCSACQRAHRYANGSKVCSEHASSRNCLYCGHPYQGATTEASA